MHILILNGPNLNLLQYRDPALYGGRSMEQIILEVQKAHPQVRFTYHQTNHEGQLIDLLHETITADEPSYNGIILNAGGYTHTSVSLRDAIELCRIPVIEVHLSNIDAREDFRRIDLLRDVCTTRILGKDCYEKATDYILTHTL